MSPEFLLGCAVLLIGITGTAFPRPRSYVSRLISLEIPAFGLLLIMLSFDETLALLTFIAVTAIATFVLVRVIERRGSV
ncbi:DUF2107 domain-containing protein [Methanoculleus sp. FWC-SCC1]|uniref:DUF2107 domain-containing protein n=2 Tax=Methanoculleus frigidifontis TaxID=2584085 RepID=A0ABT8M5X6_9EURY|nr:DUF2107 family protein [Methanoculleus sp. FWC-SCC1]MDN7023340.1 DUF2107 domain-containing protein [Methanoculleus sp. FWC-SCC1]